MVVGKIFFSTNVWQNFVKSKIISKCEKPWKD